MHELILNTLPLLLFCFTLFFANRVNIGCSIQTRQTNGKSYTPTSLQFLYREFQLKLDDDEAGISQKPFCFFDFDFLKMWFQSYIHYYAMFNFKCNALKMRHSWPFFFVVIFFAAHSIIPTTWFENCHS